MVYFANPVSQEVRDAMQAGLLGYIDTPRQGNRRPLNVHWCADNGCFSAKWESSHWWSWLMSQDRTMRFACAPDVVGDWDATRRLFDQWGQRMADEQFPVAVVAQDGATHSSIPWDAVSAVFIGGSTEWKLSATAVQIIQEANLRKTWAHVGRVNSYRRLRWAAHAGADSVDGTMLVFQPTKRLAELLKWLSLLDEIPSLPFQKASR